MPYIILLALLAVPGMALAVALGKRFEETIALYVMAVVSLGYFFAICGGVWLFPYLYYGIWLAGAIYLVWAVFLRKKLPIRGLFSFGFVVYCVLALVLWWVARGRMVSAWDEFSHWALSIKNMFYLNDIYTAPASTVTFLDYPPAGQLLQYTLLKAGLFGWREDVCTYIQGLFHLVFLVWPLALFKGRGRVAGGIMMALVFFTVPAIYDRAYISVQTDGLLGVITAYILLSWFLSAKGKADGWNAVLGCFVLSLVKDAGLGLAVMAALVILLDRLITGRTQNAAPPKMPAWQKAACCAAPFAAILLAWGSWALHKWACGVPQYWDTGAISLPGIWELITGTAPAYRYELLGNFCYTFFAKMGNGYLIRFPGIGWLVLAALFYLATRWLLPKAKRKSYTIAALGMMGIFTVFMLGLLLNYLFVFEPGEAVGLAHIDRYQATVILAGSVFFTTWLFAAAARAKVWLHVAAGALCAGVALCCYTETPSAFGQLVNPAKYAGDTITGRALSGHIADKVRALGVPGARVYLVAPRGSELLPLQVAYELLPDKMPAQPDPVSIAADRYYEDMRGTSVVTPRQWGEVLYQGYDYVYLAYVDGYFTTHYKALFEDEDALVDDVMLEVLREADGTVRLRRVL